MSHLPELIISCLIAYLLGSVSSGIIVSRTMKGPDLRTVGSGNTGASNVQRTMGWKCGLITFFGDSLKGVIACLIAEWITGDHMAALPAGLCCVIGHNWPVYYRFRGGKGVATTGAVFLYCYPVPALICIALTIGLIALFRYISLGSLALVVSYTLLISLTCSGGNPWIILWACTLTVMCFIRHRSNIVRLFRGTENKLGKKPEQNN